MKKTKHFKERQHSRKVEDYFVQKAKRLGTKSIVNGYINYKWGTFLVVESMDGKLITVHPGDHPEETEKVLSAKTAEVLKFKMNSKIEETVADEKSDEAQIISLEEYLTGSWLKKTG